MINKIQISNKIKILNSIVKNYTVHVRLQLKQVLMVIFNLFYFFF